jgi:zinc transport system substrate-binding protein
MQLLTMIQQTDAEIRGIVSDGIQETFAIYHPSLTYFAHDYGIEQLCIEDNGKEPSPVHLKELINQCRSEQVKVVFVQQEFNTHNAEIIANELKAKLVTINPLNYNWQEEIIKIARNLKK